MISMQMLKQCGNSIWKPLEIIFKIHPEILTVSILSVCRKIFKRVQGSVYNHVSHNNLLSPSQCGFCTGDSCINQFVSTTCDIFYSLDRGTETRAIFSDIPKAFDKILHKVLFYKFCQ